MLISILFLLLAICSLIKYIWHVRFTGSPVKKLKTLEPWYPLIGNATLFMGKKLEDVMLELIQIVSVIGTPLKAQIGPAIFVVLDNPEDMKSVLMSSHCLDKPYIYDFTNTPLGLLAQRCKWLAMIKSVWLMYWKCFTKRATHGNRYAKPWIRCSTQKIWNHFCQFGMKKPRISQKN